MEKAGERELKRADLVKVLDEYYTSIGREKRPDYANYSISELRKSLFVFGISPATGATQDLFSPQSRGIPRWTS